MSGRRPPEGAQFNLCGKIIQGWGKPGKPEKRIQVTNAERSRLKAWWTKECIDTKLDYDPKSKFYCVALRGEFVGQCADADLVEHTIKTVGRKNGKRGIVGVSLRVVPECNEA